MADARITVGNRLVRRPPPGATGLRKTLRKPALPWPVPPIGKPAGSVPSGRQRRYADVSEHGANARMICESGFGFQRLSTGSPTMATARSQAAWRARDPKRAVEMRLTLAAVARLDNLVQRMGARGRGEAIERLLMADVGERPSALLNEGLRLARAYLIATGERQTALRDADGNLIVARIEATSTLP